METQKQNGFTIIEVMLFLAVTGALAVGIFVGSGVAIGQQRYRDSVNSFKGLIQEQYSQIANVVNSENQNPECVQSGGSLTLPDETEQMRGTSDCLVIGRFAYINGSAVTTYNLLGLPPENPPGTNDVAILRSYSVGLHSPEEYEVSWGARVVEPNTETDSTTSIAIVRSPLSGSILTYVMNGDHRSSISDMFSAANTAQKEFCVDSGGMSAMASQLAVRINARAANQSAIEIPLESEGVCGG